MKYLNFVLIITLIFVISSCAGTSKRSSSKKDISSKKVSYSGDIEPEIYDGEKCKSTWMRTNKGCKAWNPCPGKGEYITWTGECNNDLIHGKGIFIFHVPNNTFNHKYEGEFREGKPNGWVKEYFEDGTARSTRFENWSWYKGDGSAILHLRSGKNINVKWTGNGFGSQWITDTNGCKILNGFDVWSDKVTWNGECSNGYVQGIGRATWYDGNILLATYEGHYKNGKMDGFGKWSESTKKGQSTRTGFWKENKKNGYGKYISSYNDGTEYTFKGIWNEGTYNEFGIEKSTGGETYTGELKNGKRHGLGKQTWTWEGQEYAGKTGKYIGYYNMGKWHGNASVIWPNGKFYKGQYENGSQSGIGYFYWPKEATDSGKNDAYYKGEFKNGYRHGLGYMRWDSGSNDYGLFENGKYIKFNYNDYNNSYSSNPLNRLIEEVDGYEKVLEDKKKNFLIEMDWAFLSKSNEPPSIVDYDDYISKYPYSQQSYEARNVIILIYLNKKDKTQEEETIVDKLKSGNKYISDYLLTLRIGSDKAKQRYIEKWSDKKYAYSFIDLFIYKEYQSTLKQRSIAQTEDFVSKYPHSAYIPQLRQLIKDIQEENDRKERDRLLALQEEKYNAIVKKRSVSEAATFIAEYPDSTYNHKLEQLIIDIKAENRKNDFRKAKKKNTVAGYYGFVSKYCQRDCANSEYIYIYVKDADNWLQKYFDDKRQKLAKNSKFEEYNAVLNGYSHTPYVKGILEDYDKLAFVVYEEVKFFDELSKYADFVKKYPYSNAAYGVHEIIYKRYTSDSDVSSQEKYLKDYPDSPFSDDAQKVIAAHKRKLEEEERQRRLAQLKAEEREREQERRRREILAFRNSLVKGQKVSFNKGFFYRDRSGGGIVNFLTGGGFKFEFDVKFTAVILQVLGSDVQIQVQSGYIPNRMRSISGREQQYYDSAIAEHVGKTLVIPLSQLDGFPD